MKIADLRRFALCGLAASLAAGCAGGTQAVGVPSAVAQRPALEPGHPGVLPDSFRRGIYVATSFGTTILGYRANNSKNRPPICTVHGAYAPNGVAADSDGNLIDPDGSSTITIFKGPKMCGRKLGSIHDQYGPPTDASSVHAATGTIAVASIFKPSGGGSIAVCTLAGGCTKNLRIASMYEVAGVALAANGDCWASATNSAGVALLTYFKGCSRSGQTATGFQNSYYGGLDIDGEGHLLAISAFDGNLYVYNGCNPGCSLVGGPYSLQGEAVFGHLNKKSTEFATADFVTGSVDVYAYTPKKIAYLYSFNNGLSSSLEPLGVTYNFRANR
ncbi:MAG TPA: hypothetical protein VHT92_08150 [Candidatus Cybelea sp.]|jgi:hypothetical protein|nr:hypothetical protein [Candidatus Cybelea sp.]